MRLHIEFAGPFMENHFVIIVDAYSKYLEVCPVKSTSIRVTIIKLLEVFAHFGLTLSVVSYNGKKKQKTNGIPHRFTATYTVQQRTVKQKDIQSFNETLRKMMTEPGDIYLKLQSFSMQ